MRYMNSILAVVFLFIMSGAALGGGGGLDGYDIVWDSQSADAAGSMPCGGHDIGLNVWVENNEILFYMQRSGAIAENNEYLKLGRVRLGLDPNPFAGGSFRQELKLREGRVEIEGGRILDGEALRAKVSIWVETARPIVHVEVDSNRKLAAAASYENWRYEDEVIPNTTRRRSIFDLDGYPGPITLYKDNVQFAGNDILFYHRNKNSALVPGEIIRQQKLDAYVDEIANDIQGRTFGGMMIGDHFRAGGESSGRYGVKPFKSWIIRSEKPASRHHIRIVTHIAQTDTIEAWRDGLGELCRLSQGDIEAARTDSLGWWSQFWDRSWIMIHPEKADPADKAWRAGRNYNLFRYQLGCNAYGEYPTRFNGGNFTVDADLIGGKGKGYGPDWRDWGGGVFTAQNQRLVYWPMLKSGDYDAIRSQFELYRKSLGGARARVKKYFGHDGAVFSEYNSVPGIVFGCGWGWSGKASNRVRGPEIPFGDPRANGNGGYNNPVEAGIMANQSCAYHWESQLENAYMMLEYHRFTGRDIRAYMAFIENAVIFFNEHYRLREKMRSGKELDAEGKLVIYPSTSCETYRGATNPTDIIAGLKACLESILKLDDTLLSLRDKDYYRAFLKAVPNYSYGEIKGHKVIKPAASWLAVKNIECPHFYPLFPFNRFDLLGKDRDRGDVFRDTWNFDKTFPKNMVISWHQDGIFYARMGMVEQAADYNVKKLDDSPRRYPTFWGPGHDWVPDHNWGGSGMIGLQEMAMQTVGDAIYLLPCWPKEWDADIKLHAPKQTDIEFKFRKGKVVNLKVHPEYRRRDVRCGYEIEPD